MSIPEGHGEDEAVGGERRGWSRWHRPTPSQMSMLVMSNELFGQEWDPAFGLEVYVESLFGAADIAMDAALKLG